MNNKYSDIMNFIANNEKRKADEKAEAQSEAAIIARARENNHRMQAGLEQLPSPIADAVSVNQAKIDNKLHNGEIEAALANGIIRAEVRDGIQYVSLQDVAIVKVRSSNSRGIL